MIVVRCVWCPKWKAEGTPAEAIAAQQKHRAAKHPDAVSTRKHRTRSRQVSDKNINENIAAVRQQGGATWVRKVA